MKHIRFSSLLKGIATFIPGTARFFCSSTGGTDSPRYCYAGWMRHLVKAAESGLSIRLDRIAELGPGDSLGIGLCAILCGAYECYALDAKPHADQARNRGVLEELIRLFESRAPIPDASEFPALFPSLDEYAFPRGILTDEMLKDSLRPYRLAAIRESLEEADSHEPVRIAYLAPWQGLALPDLEQGLDMVISQAVMEHVEDIAGAYSQLYRWLRPGGFMSHTIDYRSHGYTRSWNGHWTISEPLWKIIRGKRPYLINRHSHSDHIAAMKDSGFRIALELKRIGSPLGRNEISERFRTLSDSDLMTSGAFIQAVKPES